jgi:non-ribosomal peptide synthetase component F
VPTPSGNEALAAALSAKLREWRRQKANEIAMPPYIILHNTALEEIAARQPQTLDELKTIKGIGETKIESLGAEILVLVQSLTAKVEVVAAPIESSLELRLQIELWEQGGAEPNRRQLLDALRNHAALERGDLLAVIGVVQKLQMAEASEPLLQLLAETTDGNFLNALCQAVGTLQIRSTAPTLLVLLDDARPSVRRAAVRALGRLRVQAARGKLAQMAQHEDSDTVKLAAKAAIILLANQ